MNSNNNKFWTGKYDRVFKSIIADEDNPKMLKEFLSRTLNRPIDEITHLRCELPVSNVVERSKTLDLLVKSNNEYIHLELNINYPTYLHTRNLCFFMNTYVKKTLRGERYDTKSEFIHIDLTYGLGQEYPPVSCYQIVSEEGHKYVNNIKIYEFNMDKITSFWYDKDEENINKFKQLIMLSLEKNDLNIISRGDDFMEEFTDKITHLNEDEQFQSLMTYEEDMIRCQNTDKEIAFNNGFDQGITNRNKEIAKNLLAKKMDVSFISEVTGLTIEQIKDLG